jgi:hypothetical protein
MEDLLYLIAQRFEDKRTIMNKDTMIRRLQEEIRTLKNDQLANLPNPD